MGMALLFATDINAYHLVGGELTYECQGNDDYLVRLKIFRDCYCTNCADFDDPAYVFIYNSSGTLVNTLSIAFPGSSQLPVYINNPCLEIPPDICVEQATYTETVNLPPISGGYHLVHQRCCRNSTILNISNPNTYGSTYYSAIPDPGITSCNSDPYFNNFPPIALCESDTLIFDHSATDPDGDSLVYELCSPYEGASQSNPKPSPGSEPPPPPYSFVNFVPPYSATNPLNGSPPFTIDPQTGVLSGSPTTVGQFVMGVCVNEYRNGILLSTNKRDFQFNVVNCDAVISASMPAYVLECEDYAVDFQNFSSGGTYYFWDFGDGGTSTDFSPFHTYPDTGVYFATLIVNPGYPCADTAYSTVNVYPGMTADYSFVTQCAGTDLSFTDLSASTNGDITTWMWNFADGNLSTLQNPTHAFSTGGYYGVSLTTTNDKGCIDVANYNVYVYPQPTMNFNFTEPCVFSQIDFTNLTTIDSGTIAFQEWDISGLQTDNSLNTSYTFTSSGNYDITLVAESDQGCFDTLTQTIFIKPLPVSDAGSDITICPGDVINIGTNITTGYTYSWTPTTGLSSGLISNPSLTLQNDSNVIVTHQYTVLTELNNCTSSDAVIIGVYPNINAQIPPQVPQCLPDTGFYFNALGVFGPGATFSWDLGDNSGISSNETFSYDYVDTGDYVVTVTIQDNGCTSTATTIASVYDIPVATFSIIGDVGCNPLTVEFKAYSSDPEVADTLLKYYWDFGDGSPIDSNQVTSHIYNSDGNFKPSLTIELGTCMGYEEMTQSSSVTVLPTPVAGLSIEPDQVSVYYPIIDITDQSVAVGASNCVLIVTPGDTLNTCNYQQNYFDPNNAYIDTVTNYITQIVTNGYGCSDTITYAIDILPEYIFFAPNSFSPNKDGINDVFYGRGMGIVKFEMYVYDRWGDEIFYSNDIKVGWDGHANNGKRQAQQDVYVYIVNIVDIYRMPHRVVGKVVLIK